MKTKLFLILFIFSKLVNAQYERLIDFNETSIGQWPRAGLFSDGTYLYGTTSIGGFNAFGNVFKIKLNGSAYKNLYDFNSGTYGFWPMCTITKVGESLYGMTEGGGANDEGVIYKIHKDGNGYSKLMDFTRKITGRLPCGELLYHNNYLYGLMEAGGTYDLGTIFKITPDGDFTKLIDFNRKNGTYGNGRLITDGTYLYGATAYGNAYEKGAIFKVSLDGTNFTSLIDFNGVTNGATPTGSLLLIEGYLYGTTQYGGTENKGVAFKIKTDGSGYKKLVDFDSINGKLPNGIVFDGKYLYGTCKNGGVHNNGTLYKINLDGTGFVKLIDFYRSTTGSEPVGELITDSTYVYGTTTYGGDADYGTLFRYKLAESVIDEVAILDIDLIISPNPNNGHFNIRINNFVDDNYEVCIYNSCGQIVYQAANLKTENIKIKLDATPGFYFLKMKTNETTLIKKFILEKG